MHKIAQLATGNEIIQGDLNNTNSYKITQLLHDHNFITGQQLIVGDNLSEIIEALRYLLHSHDVVITIGGLGPTSDDLTRFAVAEVMQCSLVLDETSWQMIQKKLTGFGYTVTENNRQQALFPQNSDILFNPNGTANGCYCLWQNKVIIMLPGPPNECLPLFQDSVLPRLNQYCKKHNLHRNYWYLFQVSESIIAHQLTDLLKNQPVEIGYRVHYPYLQVKIASDDKKQLETLTSQLDLFLASYIVGNGKQFASTQLKESQLCYRIFDQATHGHLQSILVTPETFKKFQFVVNEKDADISFSGFETYWHELDVNEHSITVKPKNKPTAALKIPQRKGKPLYFAVEALCAYLLDNFLEN